MSLGCGLRKFAAPTIPAWGRLDYVAAYAANGAPPGVAPGTAERLSISQGQTEFRHYLNGRGAGWLLNLSCEPTDLLLAANI